MKAATIALSAKGVPTDWVFSLISPPLCSRCPGEPFPSKAEGDPAHRLGFHQEAALTVDLRLIQVRAEAHLESDSGTYGQVEAGEQPGTGHDLSGIEDLGVEGLFLIFIVEAVDALHEAGAL
ncbi:MAG: hypothetical protein ACI8S6_001042 [Myxococcota bacterium]|jgi:hypothetical protein